MIYHASDFLDLTDQKLKMFAQKLAIEHPKGKLKKREKRCQKIKKGTRIDQQNI